MTNPSPAIMRSMLGRARGLGAAKSGTATWWAERVTAIALVPLTLWFVCAVVRLSGQPRAEVVVWASRPLVATLLAALVLTTFHHMQLGLQAVIEDYVHVERTRLLSLLAMKAVTVLLGLMALIAVLRLAVTG
jgi:succinate dehydrogenase / fumarate reductase membrane anchor subunit